MIAGSFASSHHGLPRATNDADIVVDPSPEALDALLAALAADGYYADARTAREALRARRLFNVIDPETAFKVDLIVRKERPFSREEFARRERRDLGGLAVSIATPEDTILSKLEWARKAGGSEGSSPTPSGFSRSVANGSTGPTSRSGRRRSASSTSGRGSSARSRGTGSPRFEPGRDAAGPRATGCERSPIHSGAASGG